MKILRRFRFYFLEENKLRKYTLYAIGEVILIVIGILIALEFELQNAHEGRRMLVPAVNRSAPGLPLSLLLFRPLDKCPKY